MATCESVEFSNATSKTGFTAPVTWPFPSTCSDLRKSNSMRRPNKSASDTITGLAKFTVTLDCESVPLIVLTVGGFTDVSMKPITGDAIVIVADVYVPTGTAVRSSNWCKPLNCAKSTICGCDSTLTFVVPLNNVIPLTVTSQETTLGKGASVPTV